MTATARGGVWDEEGSNATASFLLNDHHAPSPNEPVDAEHCTVCGYAMGWVQRTSLGPDEYGHSTASTTEDIAAWILENP